MKVSEFEQDLHAVEVKLDRLKALYDQYFQGLERLEPTVLRRDLERSVQNLRRSQPRNTALRFRLQQVVQRYVSFQSYWNRTARKIEEGTYRRDLLKARRRREQARQRREDRRLGFVELALDEHAEELDPETLVALAMLEEDAGAAVVDPPTLPPTREQNDSMEAATRSPTASGYAPSPTAQTIEDDDDRPTDRPPPSSAADRPTPTTQTSSARRVVPPVPSLRPHGQRSMMASATTKAFATTRGGGPAPVAEEKLNSVYQELVAARSRRNQTTHTDHYEKLAEKMNATAEKYGGKVDFKVVEVDGKVAVKAIRQKT